jgi:hypothetical protein
MAHYGQLPPPGQCVYNKETLNTYDIFPIPFDTSETFYYERASSIHGEYLYFMNNFQ